MSQACVAAALALIWLALPFGQVVAADRLRLTESGTVQVTPTAAEPSVPERFRQPAGEFNWQATRVGGPTENLEVWELTFPSPVVTPHEVNNTVHCEYYRPLQSAKQGTKRPAVIVLHILGGDFPLSRLFCNSLAQHGVAALFVKMPYYGPRRPAGINRRMVSHDPRETVEGMTQAILDIRRATAWLASRPEVDDQQLGIFGISLGGITSSLAATAEPRLANVCTLLAGGDIGRVGWESTELSEVREKWLAGGGTREQFMELLKLIDPVTYAESARGKRILMLNATDDEVIPRECTESLWKALGEPEIQWYRGGHYSVIRHLPSALLRVSKFFAATDGLSQVRPIPFTAEPPTIDGKLDEPFWQVSKPTSVDRPRTRAGAITAPPPMVCKLAWDSRFLYFGYEIQDAYGLGPGVGKQGGPREGLQTTPVDSERDRRPNLAQIYVSPQGSLTEFWQVQHSSDNEFHAHACVVAPESEWRNRGRPTNGDIQIDRDRFATDAGAGVAHAIHLLPKTDGEPSNDASDFDAGYSGEIRLPWATLGLPAARQRADGTYNLANHELRILAAAINPHAGQTRCWSSGELPTNRKIHFSAERWPRYRLTK